MSYTPGSSAGVVADPNPPANADAGAAAVGVSAGFARGDHKHHVTTGSPSALAPGAAASDGASTALARADHVHPLPAFGTAAGTIAQGNDARFSDDRVASGLRTASGVVSSATAAAPSAGQVYTASSATVAGWAPLPAGVVPTRQVLAGTGLQGGGDLTADRTLSVAFGTTAGTVAAGNDSRILGAVQSTRQVTAGSGLSGGGDLSADRSLAVAFGSTAGTVAAGNDSRILGAVQSTRQVLAGVGLSGGGDLGSDRTLAVAFGTTGTTAAAGNDARIVNAVPNTRLISAGTGLQGGGTLGVDQSLSVAFGSSAGSVAQGNDSRFSDARTPTMHDVTHQVGGTDELNVQGLQGVLAEPQQSAINQPVVLATAMGPGTTEAAISAARVLIPANRMSIGHTLRWTLILNQIAHATTTSTLTFRIRYGSVGSTADALVAKLDYAAATALVTAPQIVVVLLTVRGPLAASCAAMANSYALKGSGAGIGGGSTVTTATSAMSTFTCIPNSAMFWTLTYQHGNTTNNYGINQLTTELVEW